MQDRHTPYISKTGHQIVRLLIASYFIATATGVIPYQSGRDMALLLFPDAYAGLAFSTFLFTTAYLILIGRQTRGAALLLAIFVFWSSYLASFGPAPTMGFEEFWRDLALIGGLLLTYANRSPFTDNQIAYGRSAPRNQVVPRRIGPVKQLPTTTGATLTAGRNHTGYAAFAQNPDDMANLFTKSFESK